MGYLQNTPQGKKLKYNESSPLQNRCEMLSITVACMGQVTLCISRTEKLQMDSQQIRGDFSLCYPRTENCNDNVKNEYVAYWFGSTRITCSLILSSRHRLPLFIIMHCTRSRSFGTDWNRRSRLSSGAHPPTDSRVPRIHVPR